MATAPTYPGVYIEEIPSGVRTITGVPTSITAFVGFARRGSVNQPTRLQSFAEFDRLFGGLWPDGTMSYAVQQYFLNGGSDAIIVRVARLTGPAGDRAKRSSPSPTIGTGANEFKVQAANEGLWGDQLRARVDHDTRDPDTTIPGETAASLFNLTVKDMATGAIESFRNVCTASVHPRFVTRVLENESKLVRIASPGTVPAAKPAKHTDVNPGDDPFDPTKSTSGAFSGGADGLRGETELVPASPDKTGLYALDATDIFNLLVIPPVARDGVLSAGSRAAASTYCRDHRAFYVVDPDPTWDEPGDITSGTTLTTFTTGMDRNHAALYFPRIRLADPLLDGALETFPPSGAVAGIYARTDATRGVWKAPAGQDATLTGVHALPVTLTDGENGQLNPLGVNCLRTFPIVGSVVWGARTIDGADRLASEWKYVPVRRLALNIEESLYRGTQWVVFEPNDEPLWAQIRLNVGAFMQNLFRQGAFQGRSAREAYFVKCDGETTTQNDRDLGIVNILVGFAPLKPAEFVIIRIQQIAGQVAA